MRTRKFTPTPEELNAWLEYIKDVTPIEKKQLTTKSNPQTIVRHREPLVPAPNFAHLEEISVSKRNKNYDRPIQAELDLHGYSNENALLKLENFINASWHKGHRMLLIITGKGKGDRCIRTLFPGWLNLKSIRPYIISTSFADQKNGGNGAFYVLLKRHPTHTKK